VRIIQDCLELPGHHLFQYVADGGGRCPVGSGQVNDYLRESMGDDFTAKDFRTWGATLRALMLLARIPREPDASERSMKRTIVGVVKQVAEELRNTPAVCRKSYINPVVFEAWRSGAVHKAFGTKSSLAPRKAEMLVRDFLRKL
jgi:DNA topoisomerase IB